MNQCEQLVRNLFSEKLKLQAKQIDYIQFFRCHRIRRQFNKPRSIIVRFCDFNHRQMVGAARTKLDDHPLTISERTYVGVQNSVGVNYILSIVSLGFYPMTSGGRRGAITDLLTTSRHPFRSFDTLRDSAARRQVQSLILSSHRFLWPPLLLPPLTVPCMIVFERPEDLETWPYHFSFLLLTVVSKSSYGPMARSILLRTSTFVMCSVYDMLRSLR